MSIKKEIDGFYSYRFYSFGKDYRKKGFKTRKEAIEAESKKRLEIKGYIENTTDLNILYKMYIEKRKTKVKIATLKKDELTLKKYVLNEFKTTTQINAYTIKRWKDNLIKLGFKERYTNQCIKLFRMFLSYISKYTFIDPHAIDELDIVKFYEIKQEMQIWSVDEFNTFISSVDDEFYNILFTTLFYSGLRVNELRALTKKDIVGNYLNINKRMDSKYTKSFTTPKTASSNRQVLMPKDIIEKLKALETDLLFPISETQLRRMFDKYILKSGVKKIRLHDLRHSHASFLINNGMNIKLVSQRLGHSSVAITMDIYYHLMPNEQEKIIDLINKKKV